MKKNARQRRDIHFLDETLMRAKVWVKDVEKELGLGSEQDAHAAFCAVMHALRDRLNVNEAVQLGAQLPVLLRGYYYEGWTPENKPQKIRKGGQFIERVADEVGNRLLASGPGVAVITNGVFGVLQRRISAGEISDIKSTLPQDVLKLWPESDGER